MLPVATSTIVHTYIQTDVTFARPVSCVDKCHSVCASGVVADWKERKQIISKKRPEVVSAVKLPSNSQTTYLFHLSNKTQCILTSGRRKDSWPMRNEVHQLESEYTILDLLTQTTRLPIPRVLEFRLGVDEAGLRTPHLLRSYIRGTALSALQASMSSTERARIDHELGGHFASITALVGPGFGSPHCVSRGSGGRSWREAFLALLEGALRDAEDVLICLPYGIIRHYVAMHSTALDMRSDPSPRLVPMSACSSEKVLIDEVTLQISGLIGFKHVVWGDPEMAFAATTLSPAFIKGYGAHWFATDEGRQSRSRL